MFEVVAMANYLHQGIKPLLEKSKFDRAWDVLDRANMGSYYMIQQGHKRPQGTYTVTPLKIGKAVSSLNALTKQPKRDWAEREYSFLSEFSHPDSLALMHYAEMNAQSESAVFHASPEADVGYLRYVIRGTVGMFGIVYIRLFELAELHTAKKLLERTMAAFLNAEKAAHDKDEERKK